MHVAKALDHVAMSLAMRAQSEKKELAAEAVSLGERAVRIFAANLPPSHPSVFGAHQNLSGYRSLHSSIGVMYPSGGDDSEAEQAVARIEPHLPKEHPQAIMRLVNTALSAAMRRDYAGAQATIRKATTVAARAFGDGSPMAHHVRATHIEILRRHCSFLLGEPTGQLLPSEHMYMQMRAHMRRGQAEDDNAVLPSITARARTKVRKLIKEALQIIGRLIAEAANQDGTRKAGAGASLWIVGRHVGDVLEVMHYARLVGMMSSADACDKASVAMQLHGWHSAAEAFGTAFGRNEGKPEVRAMQEEYRALVLEYEALVGQMVQHAIGRAELDAVISDHDVEMLSRAHLRVEELR